MCSLCAGDRLDATATVPMQALIVADVPLASRMAPSGWDGTVRVWDAARGQELPTLTGRATRVFAVAFSLDGHCLASTTADGAVQIWDATPPCP
jgi:WD40 repeat protein